MIEGNEQITTTSLSKEEFEGLVDVFRTLLEWEKEENYGKKNEDESDNNQ